MNEKPKLDTYSDKELVAAALAGDNACFGALVERYWQIAVALAASRIVSSGLIVIYINLRSRGVLPVG